MIRWDDLRLGNDFIKASLDDLIDLYSLQSGLAYERLLLKGQLWSQFSSVFPADGVSSGKRFAYHWMMEQGITRLETKWPRDLLPLWCSLRPYPEYARRDDVMLTLRIPKRRLLPHLYDGWLHLLNISNCYSGQSWPTYWVPPARPYVDPFFVQSKDKGPVNATPLVPSENLCRRSWEAMFDLSLIENSALAWAPTVHLVTPFFVIHDLIRFDLVEAGRFHV